MLILQGVDHHKRCFLLCCFLVSGKCTFNSSWWARCCCTILTIVHHPTLMTIFSKARLICKQSVLSVLPNCNNLVKLVFNNALIFFCLHHDLVINTKFPKTIINSIKHDNHHKRILGQVHFRDKSRFLASWTLSRFLTISLYNTSSRRGDVAFVLVYSCLVQNNILFVLLVV